ADGLGSTFIESIVRDSRGFLWFCTRDGLSRFEGHSFVNYTVADGLPIPTVNDLLETRGGTYWIATNGAGVCRFNPDPDRREFATAENAARERKSLFTVYPVGDGLVSNRVNTLHEDREGKLWAGTDDGLFVLEDNAGEVAFRRLEM